jgi:hypothetical protein
LLSQDIVSGMKQENETARELLKEIMGQVEAGIEGSFRGGKNLGEVEAQGTTSRWSSIVWKGQAVASCLCEALVAISRESLIAVLVALDCKLLHRWPVINRV